jgi:hypothetical protein
MTMDQQINTNLDQADEEFLLKEVSDEVLEAAAATRDGLQPHDTWRAGTYWATEGVAVPVIEHGWRIIGQPQLAVSSSLAAQQLPARR